MLLIESTLDYTVCVLLCSKWTSRIYMQQTVYKIKVVFLWKGQWLKVIMQIRNDFDNIFTSKHDMPHNTLTCIHVSLNSTSLKYNYMFKFQCRTRHNLLSFHFAEIQSGGMLFEGNVLCRDVFAGNVLCQDFLLLKVMDHDMNPYHIMSTNSGGWSHTRS